MCCIGLAMGLAVLFSGFQRGFATRDLLVDLLAIVAPCLFGACSPLQGGAAHRTRSWRVGLLGVGLGGPGRTIAHCEWWWVPGVGGGRWWEGWVSEWARMEGCEVDILSYIPSRVRFVEGRRLDGVDRGSGNVALVRPLA